MQYPLKKDRESLKAIRKEEMESYKPEEMLKRIIIASSNKDDLVLDPFLGSGTTAVVAKKLGRRWIGIEQSKKYVEIAQQRINAKWYVY